MDLFKLVARLGMDSSEYERGISKARGSFSALSESIGAKAVAMGNLISRSIEKAVNVAVDLGKSAIQNASDVVAEQAQFQATFGVMQGEAEKAFSAIEKATGIMDTRLQKVGTKAFSQFKGAGLAGSEALGMMEKYTNLAADAAAYYDISLEDADERLRSFLRGNTEAGDAIGLFTSESQRNSAAMEKYGAKWQNLTEAQKQMLMLDISEEIYKQSGAIGQAARESDAWTNVVGNLKEAWRQTLGTLGKPIMFVLTPVLQNVTDWLNDPDVKLKVDQFGLTIANAINWVLHPTFPTWEEVKASAPGKIEAIVQGIESVANWTLGKFEMPTVDEIATAASNWWTGQGDNAYERVKGVLTWTFGEFVTPALDVVDRWWNGEGGGEDALLGLLGWTLGEFVAPMIVDVITSTGQTVAGWATEFIGGVVDLLDWTLGELNLPTVSDVVAKINAWWHSVTSRLRLWYSAYFEVNTSVANHPDPGTWENPYVGSGPYDSGWGNDYDTGAKGISSVNDRMRAAEAQAVSGMLTGTYSRTDAALIEEIRALRQDLAQRRDVFTPDGRVIGEMVTETVSRNIARSARR